MSYINKITTAAVLTLSAYAFSSCLGEQIQQEGEVGYLSAPMLDVDVTVDDLTPTKSLDIDIAEPAVTDITFVVKDKNGKEIYNRKGLWSEPLVLPVGNYTVEASAGTNTFGVPYFTGSASGSISPLDQEVPALTLKLDNALVKVNVEESFTTHFTPGETVSFNQGAYTAGYGEWVFVPSGADLTLLMSGTNSAGKYVELTHKLAAPSAKVAYNVTCGQTDTDWPSISLTLKKEDVWASSIFVTTPASFSGNISAENQAAVVYEAIPSASSDWTNAATAVTENNVLVFKGLSEGTEYQVRARVGALVSNLVKITPEVDGLSASASHTTTSGELDGTDVTSSFSKSAAVRNAIESWNINVCKADGTPLREGLSLGNSNGSAITDTKGWPYLPVGSYKLTVTATMKDGEVVNSEIPFTTSAPTFTVTPTCKTTYDYYLAGDKANANAESGSKTAEATSPSTSLFEIGSSVGISSNLMANTNYAKTVYYAAKKDQTVVIDATVDFGTSKSNTVGDVPNLFTDWRAYELSAEVTFAGTTISNTRPFHITGLPYDSPNFLTNSISMKSSSNAGVTDWVSNGNVEHWSGRGYQLVYYYLGGVDSGNIFSPAFQVPNSTNIKYSTPVCYFTTGLGNPSMDVYTGVTTNFTKVKTATTSIRRVNSDDDPGIGKFTTITKDDVLVSNGRISISTDETKDGNAAQNWFTVASLSVDYR